jgi:lauroyl/myristoyl acyltransferase
MTDHATELGLLGRGAFRFVVALLRFLQWLPDRPLYRVAHAVGAGLYLALPSRRALVRANLERTCRWLDHEGLATPQVAAAVANPRRLDSMTRAAFGHWIATYVEAALAPRYSREELLARVHNVTPEATAKSLSKTPEGDVGPIYMSMHFGALDLSALYGARVGVEPLTGPMEEVTNPFARAYFAHVRRELDVTIVPLEGAARELSERVARGEAVGVVADRLIAGSGRQVELFGAPVRMPIGPAVLSIQTGGTLYLQALERTKPGEWNGHTVPITADRGLTRKAAVGSILEQEVRAFERLVAKAPEQWSTAMFQIWDDIDGSEDD